MARVALVRVDTTVSAVRATAGLGCLLYDNVFDEEVFERERLGVGVRFGVLQKAGDETDRLLGPATFSKRVSIY